MNDAPLDRLRSMVVPHSQRPSHDVITLKSRM
jgi:hypothetical protein